MIENRDQSPVNSALCPNFEPGPGSWFTSGGDVCDPKYSMFMLVLVLVFVPMVMTSDTNHRSLSESRRVRPVTISVWSRIPVILPPDPVGDNEIHAHRDDQHREVLVVRILSQGVQYLGRSGITVNKI